MDHTQRAVTCVKAKNGGSQGGNTASTASTSTGKELCIQWNADPKCTDKVVEYLCTHPADSRLLFFNDGKAHPDGDHLSGKDKLLVCSGIAKYVFECDPEYAPIYTNVPERFHDSTNNHIMSLKKKYREWYNKLHVTGAGVMPLDDNAAINL
ncbi:uncharacterized protein EDB91DRAFT_1298403 [Suillus paluster]|uniref:uncharacterized protein n=1 Tax=Suillus paluster TaxID=48578 RepID=UPI001B864899|nr:uncharacterized protein EDB91DRAFT_1298403 [Suillus paluster]KAG1751484.1 hypothetical protein EDB91DRAFT_1298403 [Suillus paluster]